MARILSLSSCDSGPAVDANVRQHRENVEGVERGEEDDPASERDKSRLDSGTKGEKKFLENGDRTHGVRLL